MAPMNSSYSYYPSDKKRLLDSEDSTLTSALELLHCLNTLVDQNGARLSAQIVVDGFEPWWFIQEQLFWYILVPYAQHRSLFNRLLSGEPMDLEQVPTEVRSLCRLLSAKPGMSMPDQLANQSRQLGWRRWISYMADKVAQLGLALLSLVSLILFRLRRMDTLVYTIDQVSPELDHDFRISNIYRELRDRGYRFGEYVHIHGFQQAWQNLWRRCRPVVFFEALTGIGVRLLQRRSARPQPVVEIVSDPSNPDEIFLTAVAQEVLRWCEASAYEIRVLKWLLRLHGVRRAVLLDDSRHANELIAACKVLGIPTLGYMHGIFNRYHPGLMAYGFGTARRHTFDLYGVWSEYFRQRLLAGDLYDETNTFVCGPLRPPTEEELQVALGSRPHNTSPVRVLLVSEPRARQEAVLRYVERLLGDERFHVLLKVRPGEETPHFNPAVTTAGDSLQIIQGCTVYEAITQTDVVVGTYATVLYEAALALRPVVVLNTSFTYGHDIVHDGLAEFAESPECVCDAVLRASALPEEELIRRRNVIWGERLIDGASRLFDVAEARLWGEPYD